MTHTPSEVPRRFATHTARGQRQQELDDRIAAWSSTLDTDDFDESLLREHVQHNLVTRGDRQHPFWAKVTAGR